MFTMFWLVCVAGLEFSLEANRWLFAEAIATCEFWTRDGFEVTPLRLNYFSIIIGAYMF